MPRRSPRPPKPADARPRFKAKPRMEKHNVGELMSVYLRPIADAYKKSIPLFDKAGDSDIVLSLTSTLDALLKVAIISKFRTAASPAEVASLFAGAAPL